MKDDTSLTAISTSTDIVEKALFEQFLPGITTLAGMGRKDFIKSASNVVQRMRKETWLTAFLMEWNELCKQGKVKPEFIETKQGQECRQELLDSLDEDKPDEEKFESMKKVFLNAATAPEENWESNQPQQLMKVCRNLTSEELIILGIAYHLYKTKSPTELQQKAGASDRWPGYIAEHSNGRISEGIIYRYEDELVKYRLIGERTHSDLSGVRFAQQGRLAPLGIELGEFLAK